MPYAGQITILLNTPLPSNKRTTAVTELEYLVTDSGLWKPQKNKGLFLVATFFGDFF